MKNIEVKMMNRRAYYSGIDLFKFVCALLIVALHANPFGDDSYAGIIVRQIVTPIAVPFFFATSGFLCYSLKKSGGRYAFQILKKYLIWSAIYFPFVVIRWLIEGITNTAVITYAKNFIFEGSYQTIWFLNALWIAIVIVYCLLRFMHPCAVFLLSIPWYVASCLLSSWHGFFVKLPLGAFLSEVYYSFFETTKNGLLFGVTYVALGVWMASITKNKVQSDKNKGLIGNLIALALCFVCVIVEWLLRSRFLSDAKGCDITFSLIPMTATLLSIAITIKLPQKPIWQTLRKYSTCMFLTQRIPLTLFMWADAVFNKLWGIRIFTNIPIVYFTIILIATFFISFCLISFSKKNDLIAKIC